MHKGGNMKSIQCHTYRMYRSENRLIVPVFIMTVAFFLLWAASSARAEAQKSFTSPDEAVKSLVAAVRADNLKGLLSMLGPGGKELVSSGDDLADRVGREKFLKAYDRKNRLLEKSPEKMILCTGEDDWPMPIPIVKKGTAWVFNTREGKQEILNRRIGRNELHVMDLLHAYVDAQHEYATKNCSGSGSVEFAQRLVSSKGKRDGLYWAAEEGGEQSPLGPLVARAAKEGYANPDLSPFHGYYFRILKGQGRHAKGGAYTYLSRGKMILGFGLVAYPAEYGNSGIMTFIVNQEGVIYQKNLGRETKHRALAMKIFDPDKTWKKVEEMEKKQ